MTHARHRQQRTRDDGRTTALDAGSGERRWFNSQELPSLTVRGNAPLAWGPGVLFSGNDEGTLTALGMQDGRVLWKQAVGLAEGVVQGCQQRIGADYPFLDARKGAPQKM